MDFRDKNHMIIPRDAERASDKTQQDFMLKSAALEGRYLSVTKASYGKTAANIILDREHSKQSHHRHD